MPETAVGRAPGTWWFGAVEKNPVAREKGPFSFFIGPPGTGSNARSPALQVRLISVWWTVGRAIDGFNIRISVDSLTRVSACIVRDVFFRNIGLLGKEWHVLSENRKVPSLYDHTLAVPCLEVRGRDRRIEKGCNEKRCRGKNGGKNDNVAYICLYHRKKSDQI